MPVTGNPNSGRNVFNGSPHEHKRRRTSFPGPSRREILGKPIDLTKDGAELASHSSTVADDSDDSLSLGATERSKAHIADDGRATQHLKADHRGGKSSRIANSDTETEPLDELPSQPKKGGKAQSIVQNLERDSRNLILPGYDYFRTVP